MWFISCLAVAPPSLGTSIRHEWGPKKQKKKKKHPPKDGPGQKCICFFVACTMYIAMQISVLFCRLDLEEITADRNFGGCLIQPTILHVQKGKLRPKC